MRIVQESLIPTFVVAALALGCSSAKKAAGECEPPCEDLGTGAAAAPAGVPAEASAPSPVEHVVVTADAADDLQKAFKRAIVKAGPAVVSIYSTKTISLRRPRGFGDPFFDSFGPPEGFPRELRQQGLGSGFVIDAEGHILTNAHVVEGADEIKVELADEREVSATVVGIDLPTDLAVLKVDAEGLTPVELGDSDTLEVGDFVLAIGNPFGLPQTVSAGIVSAKGRANMGIVDYESFIQTDAAVNPGNSGGPLIDLDGRVVGVNTAIASRTGGSDGIAFAIPVSMAKDIIDQLRGEGRVVRGHLGVVISELTPELADSFGFEGKQGLIVQDVTRGSAAAEAGLRAGDIVLRLDGEPVAAVAVFRNAVARRRPGQSVELEVWRDGKTRTFTVRLGEVPGAAERIAAGGGKAGPPRELGLGLHDVTPELQRQLGLPEAKGVVVTSVVPGSIAAAAGLQPGDVIEEVGDAEVKSAAQAAKLLREADVGKGVRLRVGRSGTGRFVVLRSAR